MSELGDIESAVVSLIQAIQVGGSDLFAEVSGFSGGSARQVVENLRRRRKPAASVVYEGRARADEFGVPHDPDLSIFTIVESLRGGDEPRAGSGLAQGGFDVIAELFNALAGSVVQTDRRLAFAGERLIAADDKSVVYEQRYSVLKLVTTSAPTFGGQAICGTDSIVRVKIGDLEADSASFSFPGIDGEFVRQLGLRSRAITWSGQLRADDDTALSAIEANLEDLIAQALPADMSDGLGRTFEQCVLLRLSRRGGRSKHSITSQALQDFELLFAQPNP